MNGFNVQLSSYLLTLHMVKLTLHPHDFTAAMSVLRVRHHCMIQSIFFLLVAGCWRPVYEAVEN